MYERLDASLSEVYSGVGVHYLKRHFFCDLALHLWLKRPVASMSMAPFELVHQRLLLFHIGNINWRLDYLNVHADPAPGS